MARITVSQLKHACLNPDWLSSWIRDPTVPLPLPKFSQRDGAPGKIFHDLTWRFSKWLTASKTAKEAAGLRSYEELWEILWERFGKKEIIDLISAKKPETAERLTQALRAWCQNLAAVREDRAEPRSWREIIVTAEYQFDDTPIETKEGTVNIAGRPDGVRLERDGLVIIDYKLSRGSNLKIDLLQVVIYAALLRQVHPKLSFSAQLEYYEPRLHRIRQSMEQVLQLFDEMVLPALETIARQGRPVHIVSEEDGLSAKIVTAYREHGIELQVVDRRDAPQLTRYYLKLQAGISFAQASRRATDLKLALALQQEPMISAGPGFVWFDVPKTRPDTMLWDLHKNDPQIANHESAVAFAIGVNIAGEVIVADFSDPNMAHGLVAGSSGSGKSEFFKEHDRNSDITITARPPSVFADRS